MPAGMNAILVILLALGCISSLLVIVHYVFLAIKQPARMLGFLAENHRSPRGYLYYGLLFAGWFAAAYMAAKGFLFWVPSPLGRVDEFGDFQPLRDTLAVGLALISLYMIGALETLAQKDVRSKQLEEENGELRSILHFASGISHKLTHYAELRDSATDPERKHFFAGLHATGHKLDEQVRAIVAAALTEEKTKRDSAKALEARETEHARQKAALAQRRQQIQRMVAALTRANQLPVAQAANGIAAGECLIDPALVAQRWEALQSVAIPTLALTKDDIKKGESNPRSIGSILAACAATSVTDGATIVASYSGNSHGGHTEFYGLVNGQKQNYLDVIRFYDSLEGIVEGLFFAFALPQYGTYWHGLYDRDYTFLFETGQLSAVLEDTLQSEPNQQDLATIDCPCGVRVLADTKGYRVNCMAAYPNGMIVDLSVRIAAGHLTIAPPKTILESSVTVFY